MYGLRGGYSEPVHLKVWKGWGAVLIREKETAFWEGQRKETAEFSVERGITSGLNL